MISSCSISNGWKYVLDILISRDQSEFVKGRYIGENTKLLYDIMKYYEDNNLFGFIMLINFEKKPIWFFIFYILILLKF